MMYESDKFGHYDAMEDIIHCGVSSITSISVDLDLFMILNMSWESKI